MAPSVPQGQNLSSLFPLDPWALLQARAEAAAQQSFTLYRAPPLNGAPVDVNAEEDDEARTRDIIVAVEYKGKRGDLGRFPALYYASLTVLYKKWGFYYQLYEALTNLKPDAPALISRKFDLQDHWLREVLYLERILEIALQWSHSTDRNELCVVLFLFVSQEAISTDHSLENTREVFITLEDLSILERCACLIYSRICPAYYIRIAIEQWISLDDGSRSWLREETMKLLDKLAQAALDTAQDTSPVRPHTPYPTTTCH